mmetsp:Transcript_27052/g.84174  ORF Transcript_27052/g.84174 Transcript_27052/m.84174 type:complete len:200 (+) Transcript_27052:740-1339(+)
MITVVPESGMAPQGVSWPACLALGEQNATGSVSAPTEMPRKSRPQWNWPMEPNAPRSSLVPRRRTPSDWSLKHMEKRLMPVCSRKPLGWRPWNICWCCPARLRGDGCSFDSALSCAFSCASVLGRPKPRIPSKGPWMVRAWSTMRSRAFFIMVDTCPTLTLSVASTASIWPLPKVRTMAGVLPLRVVGMRNDEERLVPL